MHFHVKVIKKKEAISFLNEKGFEVTQVKKPEDTLSVIYTGAAVVAEVRATICETPGYVNNVWLS